MRVSNNIMSSTIQPSSLNSLAYETLGGHVLHPPPVAVGSVGLDAGATSRIFVSHILEMNGASKDISNWDAFLLLMNESCDFAEFKEREEKMSLERKYMKKENLKVVDTDGKENEWEQPNKRIKTAATNGGGGIKILSSDESDEWRCDAEEANKRNSKKNGRAKLVSNNAGPMKKKNTRHNKAKPPQDATEVLASTIAEGMGGSRPRLLFSKIMTGSDIKQRDNRLLISGRNEEIMRALEEELTKDEMEQVLDQKKDGGLLVTVVDGERRKYLNEMGPDVTGKEVFLRTRFRYLASNRAFRVVGTNYRWFVVRNELRENLDALHIYVFHVDREVGEREVCLAMMKEAVQPEEGAMANVKEHAVEFAVAAPLLAEENEAEDKVQPEVPAPLVAEENEKDDMEPLASPPLMRMQNKREEEVAPAEATNRMHAVQRQERSKNTKQKINNSP